MDCPTRQIPTGTCGPWARLEKLDAVFKDFEDRWIKLRSIHENNTMQEFWTVFPDSGSQWSHASIAPLISVYSDLAGIMPLKPGYKLFSVQPNVGKLEKLVLSNHTPAGPIEFAISGKIGKRKLNIRIPDGIEGELILDQREKVNLQEKYRKGEKKAYVLPGGGYISLSLRYT